MTDDLRRQRAEQRLAGTIHSPEATARIEYWEPVRASEAPIRGLITVCEALQSRI